MVSSTKVEASLMYVRLDTPLMPEASLRDDLADPSRSGTDRYDPATN